MEHVRGLLRPALVLTAVAVACGAIVAVALVSVAAGRGTSAAGGRPAGGPQLLGEVAKLKTRYSDTFATDGHTYVTRSYAAPVNYRSGGSWQAIDNSLASSSAPGYAYENKANSYTLSLPAALDGQPVKVTSGSDSVAFSLKGASHAKPAALGTSAGYTGALPGVNATYEAQADRVKEDLVLQAADAQSKFTFDVTTSSALHARENAAGGIDFLDSKGQAQLAFAPPSMQDAAGASSDKVSMSLRQSASGYEVTIEPDKAWLAASDRKYPVTVDPTTTTLNPTEDCHMTGGTQASNHFCGFAANELNLGTDGSGNPNRPYMRFDISSVPTDAEVLEGQLHLHVDSGAQRQVDVYHLTHDSTSQRTWNTYDGANQWGSPGGDIQGSDGSNSTFGGSAGWYLLEARKMAQSWVDQSWQNFGVILKDTGTPASLMQISASEQSSFKPYLEVEWHHRTGVQDRWTYNDQRLSDRILLKTNVANGNLILQESDIRIPGTAGHDLNFQRFFNNREFDVGGSVDDLGRYWRMGTGYDVYLRFDGNGTTANFNGPSDFWAPYDKNSDGSFTPPTGMNADLKKNGDNTYTLTYRKSNRKLNFDPTGANLTSDKDRNGNAITFGYTGTGGKLTSIKDTHDQESSNNTLTLTYNGSGWLDTITDRANPQRSWHYGYTGNFLTSYTNPDGKITRYAYDASENLMDITDPRGNVTHMTYDSKNRVTSIRRWSDAAHTVGPLTQYSYPDPVGADCFEVPNVVGETIETDPNGHTIKYCWDKMQRVVRTIDGRGKVHKQAYNPNSNVSQVSSAADQAWDFGFDGDNRATNAQAPAAGTANRLTETYGYDPAITDKADPRFWLQKTLTDTQNNQYTYGRDTKGNLTDVTDGLSSQNNIHIVPNSDGTTASIRDAKTTGTTSYGYTGGDLTSITRPSPLGGESLTYDAAHPHRIKTATDGRGKVATYTYDGLDRPTTIAYSDGTSVSYGYDENGNMTSRTDATGQTTYVYDRLNRLTQENFPGGKQNNYTYDDVGNLKTLQDAGGTTSYNYGPSNLLDSMQAPGDSVATTFAYNDDDQRTTTTYPNGVVLTASYEDTSGGSNGPNRLKRLKATKGATTISDFTYSYNNGNTDSALRRTVTDKNNQTATYTYDAINRLKTATGLNGHNYTYNYDGNGNVTSKIVDGTTTSYGYNNANEICWNVSGSQGSSACTPTPTGAFTYTHDASGELATSSSGFSATYNAKQQLTSTNTLIGGSQSARVHANTNQFERASAGSTSFVTNGVGVGSETTGASTTYYRRDSGGGLASERLPSGAIYYYAFDGLGSVAALTDSAGASQNTYTYTPYGDTTVSGSVANPWQYASTYSDGNGFYKMGMRYYNPFLMRWSQQDPKEQPTDPAQANRYGYVGGDPVNQADATGLVACASTSATACLSGPSGPYVIQPPSSSSLIEHVLGGTAVVGGFAIIAGCTAVTEGLGAFHCAEAAAPLIGVGALALGQ